MRSKNRVGTERSRPIPEVLRDLHAGAWRSAPPDLDLSPGELAATLPRVIRLGSGSLVWPRLAERADQHGAIASAMKDAYRAQAAYNLLAELEIARAVSRLRAAGIEPVLVKGWAISRLYPLPAVRPAGDIDLWVPGEDLERAHSVLFAEGQEPFRVDIDLQFQPPHVATKWVSVSQGELAQSTKVVVANGVEVRVPRIEDHLRMLCFHFLGHGALRPLWLCDIALLLETRSDGFDWDRLLGFDKRLRERVVATLLLAHELLGARIDDTPIVVHVGRLPRWLVPAVLDRWERGEPDPTETSTPGEGAFRQLAASPGGFRSLMASRFPDPIRATVWMNAPFNRFPRPPLQWAAYLMRLSQFVSWRLLGQMRSYAGLRQARAADSGPVTQ